MKIIKTFLVVVFGLLILAACEDKREANEETTVAAVEVPDHDEAMNGWRDAWNANDAGRLKAYAADDAMLLMWGQKMTGDSLKTWMDSTASWMKDLRTTALMSNKGEEFAWETGTYAHTTTENDSLQMKGTYTLIWERADDMNNGDWRLKVMDISPEQEPMEQPQ